MRRPLLLLGLLLSAAAVHLVRAPHAQDEPGHFRYDEAEVAPSAAETGANGYAASICVRDGERWTAWIAFGIGEQLYLRRGDAEPVLVGRPVARLAAPTLSLGPEGEVWLTYEREDAGTADVGGARGWNVWARIVGEHELGPELRVSPGAGGDVSHRADAWAGGLWVAWQSDVGGRFAVLARHLRRTEDGLAADPVEEVSAPVAPGIDAFGAWHPDVAVTESGEVYAVWDRRVSREDQDSFDVLLRQRTEHGWNGVRRLAAGPGFEGRATIAADGDTLWIAYEEGAPRWGLPYRSLDRVWNNATEQYGPLHRFRRVHLAMVRAHDQRLLATRVPVPQPAFAAAELEERRAGAALLGVYYERPEVVVSAGRPWVVYRHYQETQLACPEPTEHHIERGWHVYGRCLTARGWSELQRFDAPQRDGTQRLSVAAEDGGVVCAWTTGRTDRREDPLTRGVQVGAFPAPEKGGAPVLHARGEELRLYKRRGEQPPRPAPEPHVLGERTYHLVFGDLHRHTDLSLCFPFYDGSLDDAYRYGIEVAELDFLGITDHTRDIARGDVTSLLWARSCKEVTRRHLPGKFLPYFAYERSHRDTDHNVISLREDMLLNFPPPLTEFWDFMGERGPGDTITIPHNPFIGKVWEHHDDEKRPLLEIYQGFRDQESAEAAHEGLSRGYHMGFIASSDHLSTSASYAGVWTPEVAREPVFRAMQARRTFGATAPIRLVVTCGEHWMGERIAASEGLELALAATGTAPVTRLAWIVDGETVRTEEPGTQEVRSTFAPALDEPGEHWVYARLAQADGNLAWSSPIWITVP